VSQFEEKMQKREKFSIKKLNKVWIEIFRAVDKGNKGVWKLNKGNKDKKRRPLKTAFFDQQKIFFYYFCVMLLAPEVFLTTFFTVPE
jgi:hypothetical protein